MPRPATKNQLLATSQENFRRLNQYVDSFSDDEKISEFPKGTLNRNIKDVLAHLYHWNTMMLGWYKIGMEGGKPSMPAEGYTWKTLPELNKIIYEKYAKSDLNEIRKKFSASYNELQKLIHNHSDNELFEKKKYNWTGATSLGSYLVSTVSSHYDWAYKLIKKAKK